MPATLVRLALPLFLATLVGGGTPPVKAGDPDCNDNGIPDASETAVSFTSHPLAVPTDAPQSAAAADLDGDGDLDLLTASFDDDKLAWYKNTDGQGLFGPQQVISATADAAVHVIAADLDGDGDQDVLAASAGDDKVAWYRNGGTGTFGPQGVISNQANGAWFVAAADLDGDGDLDVLSASQNDNKIAWYPNTNGKGLFGAPRIVTTAADKPVALAVVDLDGDSDLDVASASSGDDRIAWYENADGSGTFGPLQAITTAAEGAAFVAAADLDGDGDLDVLSASVFDDTIAWYEKLDGTDGFGPEQAIDATAFQVLQVRAADLDADSDLDVLAAVAGEDTVVWYENLDGRATFGPPQVVTAAADGATSAIAADLDGDGDLDVVSTAQTADQVAWHENGSDDCDGDAVPDECEPDCNANGRADVCDLAASGSADCNANGVPDECDIAGGGSADCAPDGVPDECEPDCNANRDADSCDIASGASVDCAGEGVPDECEPDCNGNAAADSCDLEAGTSDDCTSNGVPDECEPDCNGNAAADSCDLEAGTSEDCNGTSVPDECEAGSTAADCNVNLVPDACETKLTFTEHTITSSANFTRSVFVADIDLDGDADALSASGLDDTIAWYENADGEGGFGPRQVISSLADLALFVTAADLDGDSDFDVLSASFGDDKIAWYENLDHQGTFGPQQVVTTAANGAIAVQAADLDGDGDRDALSASFLDDKIAWHENLDGLGTFGPERPIANQAAGASAVTAADLDGDLDLDVVVASFDDNTIAWYENLDGAGTFGPRLIISNQTTGAIAVAVADLDGDGDRDAISAAQSSDRVAWHENLDGQGTFGAPQVLSSLANGVTSVFAADVDGDSDLDVLSASFFDSAIAWYPNLDGQGAFGPARVVSFSAQGAYSVRAADLDGDGDADILSASQDDDTVAWYESTGHDCNANGVPDECDIASGASVDCTGNGVPDECEPDCNGNGVADSCDVLAGTSQDCNLDGYPDECQADCNRNGIADACDIADRTSLDCNGNGHPDECEPDCNASGVPDDCDVVAGTSPDCNANLVPDECETDCNGNGSPDDCDIGQGSTDCDGNGVPDECDPDCNGDGHPNACDTDCDDNGVPDGCDPDCNGNGIADGCDIASGPSHDCNANGVPDECDVPCRGDCDTDNDRCVDALDSHPTDPHKCADTDVDGCDDCSGGFFKPKGDGLDLDADGICTVGDCDDVNPTAWRKPTEARALLLAGPPAAAVLTWLEPQDPGALVVIYDVLRSPSPQDFHAPALCLESDETDLTAEDGELPAAGAAFFYLIRAQNFCPGEPGSLGTDSAGVERTGRDCP